MKRIGKITGCILCVWLLVSVVTFVAGCDSGTDRGLAPVRDWVDVTTYNDGEALDAYLQPIWYTREVYDETVVIVGTEGSATLLYQPNGEKFVVRNYELNVTYVEGVDYTVDGSTIKRVAGGNLPYFEVDEYFLTEPADITITIDPSKCEFDFDEERYLCHAEWTLPKLHYVTVSYTTDEAWTGFVPSAQTAKTSKFIDKLKNDKSGRILYYGDSLTTGASASGTYNGGFINPYLPPWTELVARWLANKYDAEINVINNAEGGWHAIHGLVNFDELVLPYAAQTDLLVLAFGMNDVATPREEYLSETKEMAERYLEANPNGTVVLVSSMNPNSQSTWVGNQQYFEKDLQKIAKGNGSIAVAEVNSMFCALEQTGKRSRDWFANNINHPNDFGVRVYAQVILKTILGDDYITGK